MKKTLSKEDIPASRNRQASLYPQSSMKGFSKEFLDPEDYITEITYSIWEHRNIEGIKDWYHHDCVIRTPHGITTGIDPVITGTERTLDEFPDRQLLPEDIIIGCGDEGFCSSHRIRSPARHSGQGFFGKPVHKDITMLTIAECLCRENRIYEEWLVRDQASIALQLGLMPQDLGKVIADSNPGWYALSPDDMAASWDGSDGFRCTDHDTLAEPILSSLEQLWGKKCAHKSSLTHHRALRFEGPSGTVTYGRERMMQVISSMSESFSQGVLRIHHIMCRQDPGRPPRISVRWSYSGIHAKDGRYGKASQVPLVLLAITHAELRDNLIVNEWMVCDELAIYAQIAAKTKERTL